MDIPQPELNQTASVSKKGRPIFIYLLILIVFIFIAGAVGYLLGSQKGTVLVTEVPEPTQAVTPLVSRMPSNIPSVDPTTSSWLRYTISHSGVSFSYPPDWQVLPVSGTQNSVVVRSPDYVPITSGNVEFQGEVYVQITPNISDLSIVEVYSNFNDTSSTWFQKFPHEELQTPYTGVKFPLIDESIGYKRTDYIFNTQKKIVSFAYQYTNPDVMDTVSQIALSVEVVASDPLTYINSEYGFQFTLLPTWQGYTVSTDATHTPKIVTLQLPNQHPELSLSGGWLSIYMFTKEQWNEPNKKPHYLAENEQYVYATDPFTAVDGECAQLDETACSRIKEVPTILKTFRLLK